MIRILKVGKIKRISLIDEMEFYKKRISGFTKIEIISTKECKAKNNEFILNEESKNLEKNIKNNDYTICLDRSGVSINSMKLSEKLNKILYSGKSPTFIIGGALGTTEDFQKKMDMVLSFSKFTIQHDLMLILLMEQIYRSFSIISGLPYHK